MAGKQPLQTFYLEAPLISFNGRPCFVNFNDGDPVADGLKDIWANLKKSAERQQLNIISG